MFLLGVLLGSLSGAAAVAAFNRGSDDDRFTEGFNSGLDYAKHQVKWPDDDE